MAVVIAYANILVVVVLFLLILVLFHLKKNAIVTSWPFVGMLPGVLHNVPRIYDYATEVLKKSGGTFYCRGPWFAGFDFIITSDPLNIQHILNTNFTNYPKGPEFREVFEPLGDGILNADSDLWRLQRKMFQFWNIRQSKFEVVPRSVHRKVVENLIRPFLDPVSQTGSEIDLQEAFRQTITFDNAITMVWGLDPSSHSFKFSKAEYEKAFEDMQEAVLLRHVVPQSCWKLQKLLRIGSERKLARAWDKADEFMHQCLSLKREELSRIKEADQHDKEANIDMMTIYMEDDKENSYSDKFLKEAALNLIFAARETMTAGLTWFFWLVATHPHVETRILEEIKDQLLLENSKVDDKYSGFWGAKDLNRLVYLQAAIYETLRLYPSLPFNHKTAVEADMLPSGHRVKRGERILFNFYAMGRMEEIWGKDCLEFKPERWISERGTFVHVPSHKFVAFNTGPRTCLGKDMALIQMKIIAILILMDYRLRVVEGHPIYPQIAISPSMKHGLKVRVSKRRA